VLDKDALLSPTVFKTNSERLTDEVLVRFCYRTFPAWVWDCSFPFLPSYPESITSG